MNTIGRFLNLIRGVLTIAVCIYMMLVPYIGALIIVSVMLIILLAIGIYSLIYYFTMAKHMVGGKRILFQSLIMLDLFAYGVSAMAVSSSYIFSFLKIYIMVMGLLEIVRGIQQMKNKETYWRLRFVNAVLFLGTGVISIAFSKQLEIFVYLFGAIMIYRSIALIINNLRRYSIVYIE